MFSKSDKQHLFFPITFSSVLEVFKTSNKQNLLVAGTAINVPHESLINQRQGKRVWRG